MVRLILSKWLKKHWGVLIITLSYLLTFILILPLREGPWGDDFAYIQTVERYVKTGIFRVHDWASAAVIFQTFWGALFSKIFGFSIKILIFSNVFLFYFGLLAFYGTLKQLKIDEIKATVFTLFLFSFPWISCFLYTFFSDIFYLSLLLIACYFYIKGLIKNKNIYFILGSLFASLSLLNRQIGIVTPIAIFVVAVYQSISYKRINLKRTLCILVLPLITIYCYSLWYKSNPQPYYLQVNFALPLMKSIKYLLPIQANSLPTSNRIYLENFIEENAAYMVVIFTQLSPIFLIFKVNIINLFKTVKNNFRSIIIIIFLFISIFGLNYKLGARYYGVPQILFYWVNLGFYWVDHWWKVFYISIPFWIVFLSVSFSKVIKVLTTNRKDQSANRKKALLFLYLVGGVVLYYKIAKAILPYDFYFVPRPQNTIQYLLLAIPKLINKEILFYTIKETWFMLLLFILAAFLLYIFVIFKNLRFSKKVNLNTLFIGLTLLFHYLATLILARTFWQEYVISLVPLVLILMAYSLKNIEVGKARATIIIGFCLLLSAAEVRNRIQIEGVRWELGTELVKLNIDPLRIQAASWAWMPNWFMESCFQEELAKVGGDIYKLKEDILGCYRQFKEPPDGDFYGYVTLPAGENKKETENSIVGRNGEKLISKPYWLFPLGKDKKSIEWVQTYTFKTTI